ncbi:MAG: CopD family protein [Gammaproteobacteria bacterium]|nr:CopD family protein [Gammaproteobacteria bacterium]
MLWIKAFHIIAVICWFSAIFYLPRLFVYHALSNDQISMDRFVVMESKLFWGIMTPSAVATLLLGGWLISLNTDYFFSATWMQLKLGFVGGLLFYHYLCWHYMMQLREDTCYKTHRFFRLFNEAPVLIMVAIVLLVVIKPTI